jgi:copper chaperone
MIAFEVQDMSCGHCVATITKAVKAVDGNAAVQVDLASHRVTIDGRAADAAALKAAIADAGYTPVPVPAGAA